uniref:Rab11 family-interacting protein n=1 Tax=Daphnia magna TaxID=35525 RepID=A0A0P6E8L7_9CRUS
MWSPTHVQVTVCRVKGLLTKGKNGTNDAFVTISLGKEKFQTSVKQKALSELEWQEECELAIPTQGNTAEIVLTALHQNFIGVDEFLGMVALPLSNFDVYERPRTKWYALKSKPGQEGKNKNRGEIEVRVAFTVKSGSLLDLSKKEKHKGSFGHLSQAAHNIGGSLMSLGKEKKGGIKKLASSVGSKLRLPKSAGRDEKGVDGRLSRHSSGRYSGKYSSGEPDPGVISEDDDEFRFDELSHKSSGSSLNLAGGSSSLASGQGSLENLGGGELLRHNSMKRSGSSATLPNRAIQPSSSISSLAVSVTSGASKSPTQQQSDWNQKFFGSKQNKVSEEPVSKQSEEKAGAAMTTAAMSTAAAVLHSSSPPSLVAGGVPSIIIQDSFIVEKPSLSPSASPPSSKLNISAVPVPKARSNKSHEVPVEMDPPAVIPQARQRKDLPTVDEVPIVEVQPISAGEEAEAEFDTGQSLSARPRMSSSPPLPSSFPVGVNDEPVARQPPVPKPRRSPVPPLSEVSNEPLLSSYDYSIMQQPVVLPRSILEIEDAPSQPPPIQLNPFESDSSEEEEFSDLEEDNDRDDVLDVTYNRNEQARAIVLSNVDEADELMLNEDSVCEMLEKVIEEHDRQPSVTAVEVPPPKPARSSNVVELYSTDSSDDENEGREGLMETEATLDFFNDKTIEISPVEKIQEEGTKTTLQTSGRVEETPINSSPKEVRRDRLFSLFSTPNSETDTEQRSVGVVELDWSENSKEDGSQGFGGSEQLSSAMTGASNSDSAKTMDSAVSVTEGEHPHGISPSNSSPSESVVEALNRPLAALLLPHDALFTPPTVTPLQLTPAAIQTPCSVQSTASNRARQAELSWDNYDMAMLSQNSSDDSAAVGGARRSIVPFEPVDEEAKARRKRISLAPCLKSLTLESPSCDQTAGSPITEDDEDDDGAGEQAATTTSSANETHRMKMAASFHQRVVVGEDKPANNNTPRDHHRTLRDSSTSEDRLRIYQEKSREGLIDLLEERDNEISDLKDYIDSLLLKVIDTCPTVLQTPIKAKTLRN